MCCAAGTIPAGWSLPAKLVYFYCWGTRLTGSIPQSFRLPDSLQVLQLGGRLSGPFPSNWYHPSGLLELVIPSMKANAPLPRLAFPQSLKVGAGREAGDSGP